MWIFYCIRKALASLCLILYIKLQDNRVVSAIIVITLDALKVIN